MFEHSTFYHSIYFRMLYAYCISLIHFYTYSLLHLNTFTLIHLYAYTLIHLNTDTLIPLYTYTDTLIHFYTYTLKHLYTYTLIHRFFSLHHRFFFITPYNNTIQCSAIQYNTHTHTYIHTYLPDYLPTYLTYLPTYLPTYIHTYIHTYAHTHIHTYTHTHVTRVYFFICYTVMNDSYVPFRTETHLQPGVASSHSGHLQHCSPSFFADGCGECFAGEKLQEIEGELH